MELYRSRRCRLTAGRGSAIRPEKRRRSAPLGTRRRYEMGYDLSPLPGQPDFGVIVTGFKPAMIDDPKVRKALYDLWIDKGLIVFRDTDGLDTHLKLSEVFGQNEEHPLLRGVDVPQADKVSVNIGEEGGGIYEINGEERGGWLAWHKDSIYTDALNHGGILWSIAVPERGGETGFIDQIAAYEALPEDLKQRIDGLNVIYKYTRDSWESKFGEHPQRRIRLSAFQAQTNMHYTTQSRVIHPMVYTQEQTGRKVINVSPWFADGIEGMENDEGDALLRDIIERITRPERAYFHKWVTGEMVLWDNWRMLHCACGTPLGMKRHMRRTTIHGDYALGRKEVAAETAG
jgi:taurine dioxygenase